MTEKPMISGYRTLSDEEIALVNKIKSMEAVVADLWAEVAKTPGTEPAYLMLARTDFTSAFMWLNRGVTRPTDPYETALDRQ